MYLVVGLGNTGSRYEKTRHNAGWIVLDEILGDVGWSHDGMAGANLYLGAIEDNEIVYAKPLTMMNRSGESVAYLMKKYAIAPEHVIVIHDELDVCVGDIKISFDRGHGGNNGVRSIHNHINTKAITRIRIGIAQKTENGVVVKPNVLGEFNKEDLQTIQGLAPKVMQTIETIVMQSPQHARTLTK